MSLPMSSKGRPPASGDVPQGEQAQYLTFILGEEMFAIGILRIREILEYGQLTAVPMMPEFIHGVINLRGAVVPVLDLTARFQGKRSAVTRRTCIVIIEVATEEGRQDIGLVVDAVSAVVEIPDADISPAPRFGAKIRSDFIAGMGKVDGKLVIILNVDKVLSMEDLALVSQAAGMAPVEGMGA